MASTDDTILNGIAQGSLISQLAGDLLLQAAPATESGFTDIRQLPLDSKWVKQCFLVTTDANGATMLSDQNKFNRDFSSADLKWTDSSLGGNLCINPPTQFTRYADIRRPGIHTQGGLMAPATADYAPPSSVEVALSKPGTVYGMGRYYSEAIDDNNQIIHLRFGVPAYNSLTQFFTGFYNSGMASVARTGRLERGFMSSFLSTTGNLIGWAIAPLFIIPMAITMLGTAAKFFMNVPPTKFYYLKPAMPVYWTTVTNMVNQIGTNMGLISYIDTRQSKAIMQGATAGIPVPTGGGVITTQVGVLANYLPDGTIRPDGLIDVKKIACRAKVLEEKYRLIIADVMNNADATTPFTTLVQQAIINLRTDLTGAKVGDTLEDYLTRHFLSSAYGGTADAANVLPGAIPPAGAPANAQSTTTNGAEQDLRTIAAEAAAKAGDTVTSLTSGIAGFVDQVATYFVANLADGSEWASFRVDYTGAQQESFSNSVAESSLAAKINGMSSQSRNIRMDLADGNIIPGMSTVVDGVKDLISGVAETLNFDGIAALAGSAFVDIPKHWDSSTANLTRANYTMTLISPYGNPVSQMMHIWIPLSMILAGALPLSTGAQSHTSPFLVELHDRGRMMTRLGIIDSVSISRGTANLGFNNQGHCLAVDVSFSVLDLSSIMSIPAMPSFNVTNPLKGIFDSDNAFSDYLMTLASMPLSDVIYRFPMLKYQINKRIADYKSALSPANIGANLASLPGLNLLSAVMRGVTAP